jgi:uncharacterized Zn finger protein
MTATAERTPSALALIEFGHVRLIECDRTGRVLAHVTSRSADDIHRVTRSPSGRTSCTCTAGRYGNVCAHVAAVLLVC